MTTAEFDKLIAKAILLDAKRHWSQGDLNYAFELHKRYRAIRKRKEDIQGSRPYDVLRLSPHFNYDSSRAVDYAQRPWRRSLTGLSFRGRDMTYVDLSKCNLEGCDMRGITSLRVDTLREPLDMHGVRINRKTLEELKYLRQ
jgi:uncharacterized protein YjbI with pentapeptide repeats